MMTVLKATSDTSNSSCMLFNYKRNFNKSRKVANPNSYFISYIWGLIYNEGVNTGALESPR